MRWPWSVTATSGGSRSRARSPHRSSIRVGGIHAVEFGGVKTKFVTNVKFKGRFSDFVIYPPISKGSA